MLGKLYSNSLLRVLNSRVKTTSEPFSTAKPEITTLPLSYDRGPLNSRQACSGVAECFLEGDSGRNQKGKEV